MKKLTQEEIRAQQEQKRRELFAQTAENKRLADEAEARADAAVSMANYQKAVEQKKLADTELQAAFRDFRTSPTGDNWLKLGRFARLYQGKFDELQAARKAREAAREGA